MSHRVVHPQLVPVGDGSSIVHGSLVSSPSRLCSLSFPTSCTGGGRREGQVPSYKRISVLILSPKTGVPKTHRVRRKGWSKSRGTPVPTTEEVETGVSCPRVLGVGHTSRKHWRIGRTMPPINTGKRTRQCPTLDLLAGLPGPSGNKRFLLFGNLLRRHRKDGVSETSVPFGNPFLS